MIRGLILFAVVAAIAAGAAWLADHPGRVSLLWQGWRIETSAAVLMVAVALVAVAVALVYRFWLALRRSPRAVAEAWRERSRRKGYQALSKGMVAVAAGDAGEAARQERRASGLLEDPPLTLLLSAQTAQLNGDEDAASRFFRRMLDNKETEFLGVRGLMAQAMGRGDEAEALELARRAWRLQPKSAWVAEQLFGLLRRAGQWAEADAVLDGARRRKLLDGGIAERRQWVVRHQAALQATPDDAVKRARKVHDANPAFVPGALALARLLLAADKRSKAARVIERAWAAGPHPDLLVPYWQATRAEDALARMRAAEALAARNPDHVESHVAVATQAVGAGLWGEARRHVSVALDAQGARAEARLYRLMATIEEGENGDGATAREWLMRASLADPDPAWVCRDCGHAASTWSAACDHCGGFDTLAWSSPPHVPALAPQTGASGAPVLLEATESDDEGASGR